MSYESKPIPDGHVEVARYCNQEALLSVYFVSALSRDRNGNYRLTQTIGKRLTNDGTDCDQTELHQVSRPLTDNEALLWLEREICYTLSHGNSPYTKRTLALNRDENARLITRNKLEGWFFSNIARLLIRRAKSGKTFEVRMDQIPHSKIFFAGQPRDVQSQIEDREKEGKSSIRDVRDPGLVGFILGLDDGKDPGFVVEVRRDTKTKKGKQP